MERQLILPLKARRLPVSVGTKAQNLNILIQRGLNVPEGWVIPWQIYERYLCSDIRVIDDLRTRLSEIIVPGQRYAIRSSASVEDGMNTSFAGQFKTVLDAQGVDQVLGAVWSVWATANAQNVEDYSGNRSGSQDGLKMAVIIQKMVHPVLSGVTFSKNPMTGMLETVVEAVEGPGTLLVQNGATPLRWISKWGRWLTKPDQPLPYEAIIHQVVESTNKIAHALRRNVDLEWVFDGSQLYWVQLRDITTLGEVKVYSNKLAREMLPGLIKPLVWSINIPMVNGTWIELLSEVIGKNDLKPESLARSFYFHTYFDMSTFGKIFNRMGFPAEGLEMMMGILPEGFAKPSFKPSFRTLQLLPRMLAAGVRKWNYADLFEREVPELDLSYQKLVPAQPMKLSPQELFQRIEALIGLTRRAAYHNIHAPLLMAMYNNLLSNILRRRGVDYSRLDLMKGLEDQLQLYNPDPMLRNLHDHFHRLPVEQQEKILLNPGLLETDPVFADFAEGMRELIAKFGHLSDSGNDFSSAPWREKPEFLVQMVANYQGQSKKSADDLISYSQISFPWLQRGLVNLVYRRARQFRIYREKISSLYTFGYGLIRIYVLELGRYFVQNGWLAEPEDIFFLEVNEIRAAIEPSNQMKDCLSQIEHRKKAMAQCKDVVLPTVIYGEEPPPLLVGIRERLSGTPTSRGYYTGPAKVIRGLADFSKLQQGDVLVVPFSDVGWTPLFARAGAVVAESGGMLSHSSIVAREYHIPAVVSVPGACQIGDEILVTVDGWKGEVILHIDSNCIPGLKESESQQGQVEEE